MRMLRRAPGLSAVAIVTLALGIGANTAIFSAVDAVLLRPLPLVRGAADVMAVYRGSGGHAFSFPEFDAAAGRPTLDAIAAWGGGTRVWVRRGADLERASAQTVTANYFDLLGVRATLGRMLAAGVDAGQPVAVLSDAFWRQRLGADTAVVGRAIAVNGHAFTVIGIAPPRFAGLDPQAPPDLWLPIDSLGILEPGWNYRDPAEIWLNLVARLADGVTPAQAEASLAGLARRGAAGPAADPVRLVPAAAAVFDPEARAASWRIALLLSAVVTAVLLVACANVASLLLARATARRREIGVRLGLGATRGRLVRQLLIESLLLSLAGGTAGLAVAHWSVLALGALAPASAIPPGVTVAVDLRVMAFALVVSIATGVLFGLAPAWHAWHTDSVQVIRGASAAGRDAGRLGARRALVTAQVALSVVLLVGAALFVRTLGAAAAVDVGYDVNRVLLLSLDLAAARLPAGEGLALVRRVTERVGEIPGVEGVSVGQIVPFSGGFIGRPVLAEHQAGTAAETGPPIVPYSVVSPGYFDAVGLSLAGRDFAWTDDERGRPVAIVNETLAARLWPGERAVGKRLFLPLRDRGPAFEVIGVARDSRYVSPTEAQHPFFYLSVAQSYRPRLTLHVRTAGDPASLAPAVRQAIRDAAPAVPAFNVTTLDAHLRRALSRERLLAALFSGFGAVALAIAAVGIYGVLGFAIARRTSEIGVRMALGARRRDIITMVARQGSAMVAAGLALGLGAALLLARVVEAFLFGITPGDPMAFMSAAGLLTLAAAAATAVPAWRASTVDPVAALRAE
jgi:predicted permease